jgi:hypothetical protein
MGTAERRAFVPLHPLRCFFKDHQMNCCDEYGNCRQGRDCPIRKQLENEKPTPADGQLVWAVLGFIVLMLGLMTLRSCL